MFTPWYSYDTAKVGFKRQSIIQSHSNLKVLSFMWLSCLCVSDGVVRYCLRLPDMLLDIIKNTNYSQIKYINTLPIITVIWGRHADLSTRKRLFLHGTCLIWNTGIPHLSYINENIVNNNKIFFSYWHSVEWLAVVTSGFRHQ